MFRVGDFYEVLGDKAITIANAIELTLTSRDIGLPDRLPMIGIPYHVIEQYVNKLKQKGIRCLVVDDVAELKGDKVSHMSEAERETAMPRDTQADRVENGFEAENGNYVMTDADFAERPPLQRVRDNIAAVKLVKQLQNESRLATLSEKAVLSRYVGWGGLSEVFDDRKTSWAQERETLKSVLTEEEYCDARASVLSAFYTSKGIIDGIYAGLARLGVKDARVLEPSCGAGNFIGCAPKAGNYDFDAIELDGISAQIAKALYPKARILHKGYEEVAIADGTYDVVVGNVPFGNFEVNDTAYNRYQMKIHDYFLAKSIDKLRAGGILAAITSSGTLDKQNADVRRYLAERAELIAAYRLPNTAFKGNAGTEAVTDILFFRKRGERVQAEGEWLDSTRRDEICDDALNEYFVIHPENVIGELKIVSGRYGNRRTVVPHDGDLTKELASAMTRLPEGIYSTAVHVVPAPEEEAEEREQTYLRNGERNFDYCIRNGSVYLRYNDEYETPQSKALQGELSEKTLKQISSYILLREQTLKVIEIQAAGCSDKELSLAQGALHNLYDDYVKQYGYLTSPKNERLLREDNDYAVTSSIEEYDKEKDCYVKAPIFFQRTLQKAERKTHASDLREALALSRNYTGRVDVHYIGKLVGKTADDVVKALDGEIFQNISYSLLADRNADKLYGGFETYDEYLSGNIVKKLAEAERLLRDVKDGKLMLSDDEAKSVCGRLEKNITALTEVQPTMLTHTEIRVRMGATWIEDNDYWGFFEHLIGQRAYKNEDDGVRYSRENGEYFFHAPPYLRHLTSMTTEWGTSRIDGLDIFSCALNNQQPTVYDKKIEDGKEKRVMNKAETTLAREKLRAMQAEFSTWLWSHPERVNKYEKIYNERFNNTVLPQYRGDHLTFDGMNCTIELKDHQRGAVERISTGGNVLLHHSVGAGKTYEMLAGAMKLREYGFAKKPLFVVPNAIVGQWAREAKTLFPNARVLVANEEDFKTTRRKQFVSKIATGDWDMVVMASSQFVKIPVSYERQQKKLEEKKWEIERSLVDARSEQWRSRKSITTKSLEQAKKRIEVKTKKLMDEMSKRKDNLLTFEQLGVDYLFIDEAHDYKNKELITHMTNVAGISSKGSQRAFDLDMKIDYLRELHGGDKGVVFATGTPISNSMAEMYTMQTYLGRGGLEEARVEYFDAWASTFGETVTSWELKASGDGVKPRTRFARFVNLPELQMMYRTFADVKTADMLDLPVPEAVRHTVTLEPTEQILQFNDEVVTRGAAIESGGVDPTQDNMLKLTSDGKKLALDPRCYNGTARDEENTKVNACIKNIFDIYQKTADERLTQVIFCDQSTPKVDAWSVYADIKQKLVALGVRKEEIAFMQSAKNDAEKQKIQDALNNGEVRILIGSTIKCGVGANFQKKLKALHHLDVPYRPSDMEQREGRIVRQGNTNGEVDIFTYITERTFDSYSYQILESKQRFISQINHGDMSVREAADIDDTTLSYAQIKAIATANPDFLKQMQLINTIRELKMLKSKHFQEREYIRHKLEYALPQELKRETSRHRALEEDQKTYTAAHTLRIGNRPIEKAGDEEAELFTDTFKKARTNEVIGELNGMKLIACKQNSQEASVIIRGNMDYTVLLGQSGRGNIMKIINQYDRLPDLLKEAEARIGTLEREIEECKHQANKPFPYEAELKAQENELAEVNERLEVDKEEVVDEEETVVVPQGLTEDLNYRDGIAEFAENADMENIHD